jgi:hypothetical protein
MQPGEEANNNRAKCEAVDVNSTTLQHYNTMSAMRPNNEKKEKRRVLEEGKRSEKEADV